MNFYFKGDGCHVALVDGCYSYHHYMQDNFDDNVSGVSNRICKSRIRYQSYALLASHQSVMFQVVHMLRMIKVLTTLLV